MAFVRDKKTSNVITNINNITVALPNLYEAGDTLLMLVSKDSTAGNALSTPAGWVKLPQHNLASSFAVYRKYNVSASETPPNVSSSDSDTWAALCISLGGVATSGVLGALNGNTFNVTTSGADAYMHNIPSVVTTADNSLVIYLYGSDGSGQALTGGNALLLNFDDGVLVCAFGWYKTQAVAGDSGELLLLSGSGEQFGGYTLEIKDGSGGAEVLAYMEGGLNETNLLNGLHGIESNSYLGGGVGAKLVDAPNTPIVGGFNVSTSPTVRDQADANAMPYTRACRIEADRSVDTAYGMRLELDRTDGNAIFDMSGHRSFYAIIHHRDLKVHSLGGLAEEFGTVVLFHDNSGNWKAFGVDGRNATRKLASPIAGAVVIALDSSENVIDSSGTLNTSAIQRVSFLARAELGNNHFTYICNLFILDPFVLLGGSSGFPATMDTLVDYGKSKGDSLVQPIGDTYLIRNKLQIGNHVDTYTANFEGKTIIFAPSEIGTHIVDNHFGLVINPVASGQVDASNSTWVSSTPFTFDITGDLGTIDFTQAVVKHAGVFNIRGTFIDATLIPATIVDDFGADITGATIDGSLRLNTIKDLTGVTVTDTLTLSLAGTYEFTDCDIDSVTNSSGGLVVINNVGGQITTNLGPDITINNNVPITISVTDTNGVAIENARVRLLKSSDESIILQGLTSAAGVLSVTYNYSIDTLVVGWVRKSTGSPLFKQANIAGTILSSGFTANIQMILDE